MKNSKLYRIYTGDYTDVGYRIGSRQAEQGQPKTFWSYLTDINVINQFWRQKEAYKTLKTGINSGYQDKLLAQNIAQTLATAHGQTQGTSMSHPKSYDEILMGLNTAKRGIEINITNLETYLKNYASKMADMQNAGFLKNYVNKIDGAMGLNKQISTLQNVLHAINAEIDAIREKIETLEAGS